jgi:hypothetical protein
MCKTHKNVNNTIGCVGACLLSIHEWATTGETHDFSFCTFCLILFFFFF